jgi:hypothetical protein
VLEYKKDENF